MRVIAGLAQIERIASGYNFLAVIDKAFQTVAQCKSLRTSLDNGHHVHSKT